MRRWFHCTIHSVNIAAILLVIFSAFIHVIWNVASKRRKASAAFFLLASLVAGLVLLPCLYFFRAALPLLPFTFWMMVVATGLFQTIYFAGLANAYQHGDMAVAYPLLRSLPVIAVALISLMLRDGLEPRGWGLVGIALVALGCFLLPLVSFRAIRMADYLNLVCLFAVVAAAGTTGYSLVDDRALRLMETSSGAVIGRAQITLLYLCFQTLSTNVFLAIYVLTSPIERARLVQSWPGQLPAAIQVCFLLNTAYGLVLAAMTLSSSVSYIVAFRQLSIPLGAFVGMTWQNEPRHLPRLVGIGVVTLGLVVLALAR